MQHSKWYATVKKWYGKGRWKKAAVQEAVKEKKITVEEYEEIVGEPYPEAE